MVAKKQVPAMYVILAENCAVALLIFLSAFGLKAVLTSEHTSVSPVWPAGGVALTAALMLGWRVFPGIFLPLAAGSFFGGNPWIFSVLAPLGVALSIYMGRALLGWRGFNPAFVSTRDVLLLAGLGAALPMGLAGFWTAACLWAEGRIGADGVPAVGLIYWVANTAGAMVLAPALLLFAAGRFSPGGTRAGWLAGALFQQVLVLLAAWLAFFGWDWSSATAQALAYLPFPFLVWMALVRGLCGSTLAVLGVVGFAVAATSMGSGPFVAGGTLSAFWQIEVFIAIIATSGLLIGAGSDAQRREKALQAEAATRKAELERLKAQVNPHFLFNCLTAIQSLIRTDSDSAEQGLTSLSSLLRRSLDVAKHPLIPLAEELDIIREVLKLQKMRYEEGLEWSVSADKDAENFRVPPMLLQPLVENAVKHGVEDGFGRLDLTAVIENEDLLVRVRNTAPRGCDPAQWKESVGLASVRARIAEACPEGSSVEFSKTQDGWIEALVRIKAVVGAKAR